MNRMIYRGGQAGGMGTVPGGPLGKAKLALATGRPDEAERLLRKRLERQSDDANARLLLAQALLQLRQIPEATTEVRRVLREQPKNVDALLLLSAALVQQGQFRVPEEAETSARRAVQLQPKLARAHIQLAEVLAAKKEYAEARIESDEAIKLEPRNATAHMMRALIALSDKDPQGAILSADSALRYDRSLAQAEFIKANALKDVKRYDEALTSLDSAARQNPMLAGPNLHTLKGSIFFKQRKIKQSYGEFLSAQRMSGKLLQFAPVLAALNMVLSVFGSNAPFVLGILIAVIVVLILTGISFIPVAGVWISSVLVVGIVGFFCWAGVRYTRGALLPAGASPVTAIGAMVVAGLAGFGIVTAIWGGVLGFTHDWFSPLAFGVAGSVGLILAALTAYFWPVLGSRMGRFGARRVVRAG